MAYYDNPTMLKRQLENIASYSQEIKDNLELIVIDDCSPTCPARIEVSPGIPVKLFRMKENIAWNQDACRNIGAYQSNTPWLLLTDIDHLIPEKTMLKLVRGKYREMLAYRFSRVSAPEMQPYKFHPNTWFISMFLYRFIGGYDESYAGYYGTDGDFRSRLEHYTAIQQLPEIIIRVPREVIPDASTTSLVRKSPESAEGISRIKKERGEQWLYPKILSFECEEVIA